MSRWLSANKESDLSHPTNTTPMLYRQSRNVFVIEMPYFFRYSEKQNSTDIILFTRRTE